MKKPLKKVALITGATSGIGRATAKQFAKHGYHLILTGRRNGRLKDLSTLLKDKYAINVLTLNFDIRNNKEVIKAVDSLQAPWNQIDVLINNAGLAVGVDGIDKANVSDWDIMIDTNIKGVLYMTRQISPLMIHRGEGHIINLCSTAGHEVYVGGSVYCASKYAINALTKAMRLEFFSKGLRVSQVSPGAVEETEFSMVRYKGDIEKANIYADFNPLTSKDVAKVIYYVASQPKHVNIQDVLFMGTQQASATTFDRTGRKYD